MMKEMGEAGCQLSGDVSYQEARNFHDSKDYDIHVDQTHLIQAELKSLNSVLNILAARSWCLASAPLDSQYITCDRPAVLSWIDGSRNGKYPVGHGLSGTVVIFPLCSSLLLFGTFELQPEHIEHNTSEVAELNTIIAHRCAKQLYARDSSFELFGSHGQKITGQDLAEKLNSTR